MDPRIRTKYFLPCIINTRYMSLSTQKTSLPFFLKVQIKFLPQLTQLRDKFEKKKRKRKLGLHHPFSLPRPTFPFAFLLDQGHTNIIYFLLFVLSLLAKVKKVFYYHKETSCECNRQYLLYFYFFYFEMTQAFFHKIIHRQYLL